MHFVKMKKNKQKKKTKKKTQLYTLNVEFINTKYIL